ncbi:hypothetical protein ACU8KH_03450 [Lachancea thermotolerans]
MLQHVTLTNHCQRKPSAGEITNAKFFSAQFWKLQYVCTSHSMRRPLYSQKAFKLCEHSRLRVVARFSGLKF